MGARQDRKAESTKRASRIKAKLLKVVRDKFDKSGDLLDSLDAAAAEASRMITASPQEGTFIRQVLSDTMHDLENMLRKLVEDQDKPQA